ncbi:hypothetical protein NO995_09620 [Aestuariibaculum sp. M13]|uniref:hypothetical protein n=1 Tax=Aestuariibaculum sp. M13 TaxID=2967132 RepID=UPI00215A064E|nr:hypothetical protein [Aestuariibaculum sp. M13]MCR8667939.1 hypothetical protein [Aestuariibaculum sp. M13]
MENILYQVAKELQKTIEDKSINEPVGACYLYGHCLTEIFGRMGLQSRKVSGKLAILQKKGKCRYITYGKLPFKGQQVGVYHTWCEVIIDNEVFIIDPSLKSNLNFIQKTFKIKIDRMVEQDVLVTSTSKTYYYKYFEDTSLESASNTSLISLTTPEQVDLLIDITLEGVQKSLIKKSA